MHKLLFPASALAVLMNTPAVAQTPVAGLVDRSGSVIQIEDDSGSRTITLYTTSMQDGTVPRRVDLSRYRGKPVALLCQVIGTNDAWGCEAIGRLVPTRSLPAQRRR